ncbi:MAG: 5-oxoprolinase subunit PxpB [Opitutus sp.]|nr:5-oxoprolinase subunit PxpB [Opitutus sp.]
MRRAFCFARACPALDKGIMTISPLGDSAVVIVLGENVDPAIAARVRAIALEIERHPPNGVVDVVPAFASVAVFFDPARAAAFDVMRLELEALIARANAAVGAVEIRTIEIPVRYGGESGPDLATVAAHTKLSASDVIALHEGGDYLVHAIGFAPGFPYLGGLPPELATPRRATPRPRVPAGSVGIGGIQTGVYSLATPGGWNLIGCTPLRLFDAARPAPALLHAGDRVKFRAISASEFAGLESECHVLRDTPPGTSGVQRDEKCHVIRDTMPGIEVVRAGMFTTVQDLGRVGHRAQGVPLSGAADPFALRLANLLVGNPEHAAGIEFTLIGPELKFLHDTVVAFGGADFGGLPRWRPIKIEAGTVLKLGAARTGCRGYLAVAGGIDVTPVLGSRSTYVSGGLGGWAGRVLRDGDFLPVRVIRHDIQGRWRIDERILPKYAESPMVRVIRGANAEQFDREWISKSFQVSPQSDRMGVRLTGDPILRNTRDDLVSSPVTPGTVQVPPDGRPIVLLADAQTIGGYPQLAQVISVDLPLVAQLRPHDSVRFREVTLDEARGLALSRERAVGLLREGLAQKISGDAPAYP